MYKITINNYNIEVEYAETFKKRLFGLMGKKEFNGLLFKQKYSNRFFSSIHTSFMLVPIDLIYIDKNMRISQTTTINPWKIFIPKDDNTKYILELPENSIIRRNIKINTKVKMVKVMDYEEIPPDTPPYTRKKIQSAMNYTRQKLKKGKFNIDDFEVVNVEIESEKIGQAFDNYTIIQLTDIHLGQWITKEKLMGIVELINKENADLIVLTGDYVSYQVDDCLDELEESLRCLKAKDAVLSVLGNHDHWINPVKVKHSLERCNIINLENEVFTIYKDDLKLQIAGVDSITYNKDDINQVMKRIDENSPAIMLAHEPDFADITSKYDPFILQLSGHSHGGQMNIPKLGTPIRGKNFLKYPSGKYNVNNMIQYTSRGVGTNAFWLRINCPPEITKIILRKV